MSKKEALERLIEAVEAGDDAFVFTDEWIDTWQRFCPQSDAERSKGTAHMLRAWDAYKGSLDAGKALHEALLPGWGWSLNATSGVHSKRSDDAMVDAINPFRCFGGNSTTAVRAWLIAILKAKLAEVQA